MPIRIKEILPSTISAVMSIQAKTGRRIESSETFIELIFPSTPGQQKIRSQSVQSVYAINRPVGLSDHIDCLGKKHSYNKHHGDPIPTRILPNSQHGRS